MLELIIAVIVGLAIGGIGGYIARKKSSESLIGSAEAEAQRILEAANRDIEAMKKEALIEAKDTALQIRNEAAVEAKEIRTTPKNVWCRKKMPWTANLPILKRKKTRFLKKKINWKKHAQS